MGIVDWRAHLLGAAVAVALALGILPPNDARAVPTGSAICVAINGGAWNTTLGPTSVGQTSVSLPGSGNFAAGEVIHVSINATATGSGAGGFNLIAAGAGTAFSLAAGPGPFSNVTLTGAHTVVAGSLTLSAMLGIANSGPGTTTITSTVTCSPVTVSALVLTSTPSATTLIGSSYSQTNVASGGTAAYSYQVLSGTLPAGTSLNASSGTVSGTPTAAGPFSYVIRATDSTSPTPQTADQPTSGTIGVPADSLKLRQLQDAGSKVVAQTSGQAIAGAIDQAIDDAFNGGPAFSPGAGGGQFNFFADQANERRAEANPFDAIFGTRSTGKTAIPGLLGFHGGFVAGAIQAPPAPREWLLWSNVKASGLSDWWSASTLTGTQFNGTIGLSRRLSSNFLLGAVAGFEAFDYRSDALNGKLTGNGWTGGAYLGWMLAPGVRFDASAAYSRIGYDGQSGAASGSFAGDRLLLTSRLAGSFAANGFVIDPSASLAALWEWEDAYTDSLNVQQSARSFDTARATAGAKFAYPMLIGGTSIAPYLGLYADYGWSSDTADAVAGTSLTALSLLDGFAGRVTTGVTTRLSGGTSLSLGGELGGIGGTSAIWSVRAGASLPF